MQQKKFSYLKKIKYFLWLLSLLLNSEVFGGNLNAREFYLSESILMKGDSPKLNFEKNSNLKWFEEKTSLNSDNRTELGIKNLTTGYIFSYRNHSFQSIHIGRGAKFECFLVFCAWIDTSIISGIDKSEKIDYKINMQQIWIEKLFGNSDLYVGLIAGINVINVDLNVSSTFQNYQRNETVPIPFIGLSSKYKLGDKFHAALNIHHFQAQKNNTKFSFHDSEIELSFDITKYLKASIGNNIVYLNLSKYSKNLSADIYIPQNSPYLKITFTY